jgi:hypothetical protein
MKNIIAETLSIATVCDITYNLKSAYLTGYIAAKYEAKINIWNENYVNNQLDVTSTGISLHSPDRDILMEFIKHFGGDFEKNIPTYEQDKMNYVQKHKIITGDNYYNYETYHIRATSVEPPAACKIVEEEVIVPAHKKMVRKIVCPSSDAK